MGVRKSDTVPPYWIFVPYSRMFPYIPVSFSCNLILQELYSYNLILQELSFTHFLSTLQLKENLHKYFALFTQLWYELNIHEAFNNNVLPSLILFRASFNDARYLISLFFIYWDKMWMKRKKSKSVS